MLFVICTINVYTLDFGLWRVKSREHFHISLFKNYLNTLVAGHLLTNSLVFGKISLFLRIKVNTIIL